MNPSGSPRLSQHFLHDRGTAERIADALRAPEGARVLEIGPGRGALTGPLLGRAWRVTAVELDARLAGELERRWGDHPRFEVVRGDALDFDPRPEEGPWWVIGNLPYAITSPLIFHLLDRVGEADIRELVFMIQREVAGRLTADPGTKAFGALTVGVRLVADVEHLFDVRPGAFTPPPEVVSSVVRLVPHDRWNLDPERKERVRELVRTLFGQRRKQIQKVLRTAPALDLDRTAINRIETATEIDLRRRPETLAIPEWLLLEDAVRREKGFSP